MNGIYTKAGIKAPVAGHQAPALRIDELEKGCSSLSRHVEVGEGSSYDA